jgi:hypothetical protein
VLYLLHKKLLVEAFLGLGYKEETLVQIKDLETQIRDLEFYLSSQKKLEGEQVERIEFR